MRNWHLFFCLCFEVVFGYFWCFGIFVNSGVFLVIALDLVSRSACCSFESCVSFSWKGVLLFNLSTTTLQSLPGNQKNPQTPRTLDITNKKTPY